MPNPYRYCGCHFDYDTGNFEPCEEHQQEYVDWLERQVIKREAEGATNAKIDG